MTIEEAIQHAEEVAEKNEWFDKNCLESMQCKKCAEEHRQLAAWLKDYKRLLEQESTDPCETCEYAEGSPFCLQYCPYDAERTKEQKPCSDAVSRQEVLDQTYLWSKDEFLRVTNPFDYLRKRINSLQPVTPQPKTLHCKDCKWWKDSDGVYRRGVRAESKCPINNVSVNHGFGYCYMFEPQESGEKE